MAHPHFAAPSGRGRPRVHVLHRAEDVRDPLLNDEDFAHETSFTSEKLTGHGREGIGSWDRVVHRERRREFLDLFGTEVVDAAVARAATRARELAAEWTGPVDVHAAGRTLALDTIAHVHLGGAESAELSVAIAETFDGFRPLERNRWPVKDIRHALRNLKAQETLARILDDADRRVPFPHLSDEPHRDDLYIIIAGAQEGLAAAIATTLWMLAESERDQERVRAGDAAYLDAVIAETLRLWPPNWYIGRRALRDSAPFAAGDLVLIDLLQLHRDERSFDDPVSFSPERWLDGDKPEPFAYLPYGAGPRRCLGERLAGPILRAAVGGILRERSFAPGRPVRIAAGRTLLFPDGLWLVSSDG